MTPGNLHIELLPPSFEPWVARKPQSRQIIMLMSGGVDSSVAAYLLKDAGWDVLGITMKIPVSCGVSGRGCCGVEAALVCHELGICHYFLDVTTAFEQLIIEPFRQSYAQGMTPNPCVDCNTLLKFSLGWDFLQETFGINYLATGHYARVVKEAGSARLARADDKGKDQSYFLYGVERDKLARLVLPLGDLSKDEVRSRARQLGLSVAEKAESMELCFAGEGDYRVALAQADANRCGQMTDMQGNEIGTHQGIANYTIGQRRGLGFAGGKPLYVGRIDVEHNTVALGSRDEVCADTIGASQINRLIPAALTQGAQLLGKIRSYGDPSPCTVVEIDLEHMTVEFDESRFAPSPGQKLVLYDPNDNVVAGGTIDSSC